MSWKDSYKENSVPSWVNWKPKAPEPLKYSAPSKFNVDDVFTDVSKVQAPKFDYMNKPQSEFTPQNYVKNKLAMPTIKPVQSGQAIVAPPKETQYDPTTDDKGFWGDVRRNSDELNKKLASDNGKSLTEILKSDNYSPGEKLAATWLKLTDSTFGAADKNKYTHRALETARQSVTAGAYQSDQKSTGSKAGDFLADTAGSIAGFGVNAPGLNAGMGGALDQTIGKKVEEKVANKLGASAAEYLPKGLQYATTAAKTGAEFGALNSIEAGLQGKDAKDIALSGLQGVASGALWGVVGKAFAEGMPKVIDVTKKSILTDRGYQEINEGLWHNAETNKFFVDKKYVNYYDALSKEYQRRQGMSTENTPAASGNYSDTSTPGAPIAQIEGLGRVEIVDDLGDSVMIKAADGQQYPMNKIIYENTALIEQAPEPMQLAQPKQPVQLQKPAEVPQLEAPKANSIDMKTLVDSANKIMQEANNTGKLTQLHRKQLETIAKQYDELNKTSIEASPTSTIEAQPSENAQSKAITSQNANVSPKASKSVLEHEEIMFTDKKGLINGGKVIKQHDKNLMEVEYDTEKGKEYALVKKNRKGEFEHVNSKPTPASQIPMNNRTNENVGNRQVKAYQYLHPELKHFIQGEAHTLLGELNRTKKGDGKASRDDMGQVVSGREQRVTTQDVARLLDGIKFDGKQGSKYAQIEKAIRNIIEDNGSENNALSKKVEIILDDRLSNGYFDDIYGDSIPVNNEYISLKNKIEGEKKVAKAEKEVAATKSAEKAISEVREIEKGYKIRSARGKTYYVARLKGLSFTRELINKGQVNLVGQTVSTPAEVATLAQIFRDPRFETQRYIYVKDNKIIAIDGVTSRVPNSTKISEYPRVQYHYQQMKERIKELGADGYYMLHNHPTGDPSASRADISTTKLMNKNVPGMLGHVIINSNKYGFLDGNGEDYVKALNVGEDFLLKPELSHEALNQIIDSEKAAILAKQLQLSKNTAVVLYMTGTNKVRAVEEIPTSIFKDYETTRKYLKNHHLNYGSPKSVIVTGDNSEYKDVFQKLIEDNFVEDIIYNQSESWREKGINPKKSQYANETFFDEPIKGMKVKENAMDYKPSTDLWKSGKTFMEIKKEFPELFEASPDAETDKRHPTQIATTTSTYKQVYEFLKNENFKGNILDASSGLGLGTQAGKDMGMNVDDVEPFPDKNYKPKYTDYSKIDKKYDVIINNAVLNVIPQDFRNSVVADIGRVLKPNGRALIMTRGKDVLNSTGKKAIDADNWEYFIPGKNSYQKGFKPQELKAYIEDVLGSKFSVEVMNKKNSPFAGKPGVVVTKIGTPSVKEDSASYVVNNPNFKKWFEGSKVVDSKGKPLVVYHGTPDGNFDTFKKFPAYFSPNKDIADIYQSPTASSISYGKKVGTPDTKAVYLKIEKPFDTRIPSVKKIFDKEFFRKWGNGTPLSDRNLPDWTDGEDIYEFIEEMGYDFDGVILDEGGMGGYGQEVIDRGISYLVFKPEQIKSATGNNGDFDSSNPSIVKEEGSEYKTNETMYIGEGRNRFPVFKNPTFDEILYLKDRFEEEYPFAPKGEPKTRTTYDKQGNKYMWMSGDSMHYRVENWLKETRGIEANQNQYFFDDERPRVMEKGKDYSVVDKTLVALHNISADKLLKAIDLGGMPVPSIAVAKKDIPFEFGGNITLVGNKDLVNPEMSSTNKVYDTDVYSRRMPSQKEEVKSKAMYDILDKTRQSFKDTGDYHYNLQQHIEEGSLDDAVKRVKDYSALKLQYLRDKGQDIKIPMRDETKTIEYSPEMVAMVKKFVKDNPSITDTDSYYENEKELNPKLDELMRNLSKSYVENTYKNVDGLDLEEETRYILFRNFSYGSKGTSSNGHSLDKIRADIRKVLEPKKVTDTKSLKEKINSKFKTQKAISEYESWLKDFLSPAFGRKYFDANGKKIPYDIESVFEYMAGRVKGTENFHPGPGTAKAMGAYQFKSYKDMHKHEGSIQTRDNVEAFKKEFETKNSEVMNNIIKYNKYPDGWDIFDYYYNAMGKYLSGKDVVSALRSEDFNKVPSWLVDDFKEVSEMLRNAPVSYFEAKPQRIVKFNEFVGAVVPKTTPKEVIDKLKEVGIKKVVKYDESGNDYAEKRNEAVLKFNNAVFEEGSTYGVKEQPNGDITKSDVDKKVKTLEEQINDISPELQAAAKKQLKSYQKLRDEMTKKGITKMSKSQVEALIQKAVIELPKLKAQQKATEEYMNKAINVNVDFARAEERLLADSRVGAVIEKAKKSIDDLRARMAKADNASMEEKARLRQQLIEANKKYKDLVNYYKKELKINVDYARAEERLTARAEAARKKAKEKEDREEKARFEKRKKLLKKVEKKLKYMRAEYQEKVHAILDEIQLTKPTPATLNRLQKMKEFFEDDENKDIVIPKRVLKSLERLNKTPFKDLSEDEQEDIVTAIQSYVTLNNLKNELIFNGRRREIKAVKADALDNIIQRPVRKGINLDVMDLMGDRNTEKSMNVVKKIFTVDSYDPELITQMLDNKVGNVLNDSNGIITKVLHKDINVGNREQLTYEFKAMDELKKLLETNKIKVDKWSQKFQKSAKNVDTFTYMMPENKDSKLLKPVIMSREQRMEIYLNTFNPKNLEGMLYGGISIDNKKRIVTPETLKKIISDMSADEKLVADKMLELLNREDKGDIKEGLNRVSTMLNGYPIAMEDGYWPKNVNEFFRHKDASKTMGNFVSQTIEGQGHLQERTGAVVPVRIHGAFQTFAEMIHLNSVYIGLANPVRNAKTLLQDVEFRSEIYNRYGKEYYNTLEKLIKDIEGNALDVSNYEKFSKRLMSNITASIFGLNPFIPLKQPIAYINAMTEIDPKYLSKALFKKPNWDEIKKYDVVLRYRAEGNNDREIGEMGEVGKLRADFTGKTSLASKTTFLIGKFDLFEIGHIWEAVKLEVRDKKPGLQGDAFFNMVAARAEEIINRHQPSTFAQNRSEIGRSNNLAVRGATAFTSQANKVYNQVGREFLRYNTSQKRATDKSKLISNLVGILFVTSLAINAVDNFRDFMLGRGTKSANEQLSSIINSMIGNIYFVGPIWQSLSSKLQKGTFQGQDIQTPLTSFTGSTLDAISEIINTIGQMVSGEKYKTGENKGTEKWENTIGKAFWDTLNSISQAKGIPLNNMKNIGKIITMPKIIGPVKK